jgi:hypothetical protein
MEIGEPKEIHEIEPLSTPVPETAPVPIPEPTAVPAPDVEPARPAVEAGSLFARGQPEDVPRRLVARPAATARGFSATTITLRWVDHFRQRSCSD